MHNDLLPAGDPLRHIDPRYEPLDPLFDFEEPDLPPRVSQKRRRKLLAAIVEGDPLACAME
jgi:hypothetical protein